MGKRRLTDRQTHAVDDTTDGSINFAFHPVRKGWSTSCLACEVGHLADYGFFRLPEALFSQGAANTGGLRSLELVSFFVCAAAV